MQRRLFALTVVAGLIVSSDTVFASNYDLEQVRAAFALDDATLNALRSQGITTTDQLYERAPTAKAARTLAKTAGVDKSKVERWAAAADLMRIRGIGPDVARLLAAVGVANSRALSEQDAKGLSQRIEQTNATQHLTENTPSAEHLSGWIAMAKSLPSTK